MKVLHLTTHMGGGIGRALSDLVDNDYQNDNSIIILQKPEKTQFIEKIDRKRTRVYLCPTKNDVNSLVEMSDIVIVHWWHHPIMCKFLFSFQNIKSRLVLWSHVSGCTYPFLSNNFIKMFDRVIMTSLCTLDNNYWTRLEKKSILERIDLVYGQGKIECYKTKESYKTSSPVRIGYVGTMAKSKINNDFVVACRDIIARHKNVEFIMVGDVQEGNWIKEEAEALGVVNHIKFVGYVNNIKDILTTFDVFGYPLNPYCFATTENSIIEALAAGIPTVLLNQGTEKYIVSHGINGLLSESIIDYVDNICKLIENYELRSTLGTQAAKDVKIKYDYTSNLKRYYCVIEKTMKLKKTEHNFAIVMGETPYEWMLSAINPEDRKKIAEGRIDELPVIFKEKSKSSVLHFEKEYYEDQRLKELYSKISG